MKFLIKKSLFVYVCFLVLTVAISGAVLVWNLNGDLYPPEQDSIMIPLVDIFAVFGVLLVFLIVQALMLNRVMVVKGGSVAKFLQLILSLLTILVLIGSANYWLKPNYVFIGVSYITSLLAYFWYVSTKFSLRKLC